MHGTMTLDAAGADVPPAVIPKGIAVLGSHPATVMLAPFSDDWLIYACSPHNFERRQLPRWDEWFEIHIPLADKTRAYPYLKFLETVPLVWMRDKAAMHHFPGARLYPEDEMKAEFGPFTFTSSIAFMIAKAIKDCEMQGIRQIGLWGIMQASATEYAYQRPGIQNLIWEANRRGIKVVAPDVSKLFEPPPEDF
jgi:hypothetical protein